MRKERSLYAGCGAGPDLAEQNAVRIRLNAPAIRTLAQNVAAQTVHRYTFTGLRTGLYYPYIVGFAANYPAQR